MVGISTPFLYTTSVSLLRPLQPHTPKCMVWAVPRSLAATNRISFDFFSYGYLDVSVPHVRFNDLCIQSRIAEHHPCWVPPFGNLGVKGYLHLIRAYRSLSRPSSLSRAKASALHLHSPHQFNQKYLAVPQIHWEINHNQLFWDSLKQCWTIFITLLTNKKLNVVFRLVISTDSNVNERSYTQKTLFMLFTSYFIFMLSNAPKGL